MDKSKQDGGGLGGLKFIYELMPAVSKCGRFYFLCL